MDCFHRRCESSQQSERQDKAVVVGLAENVAVRSCMSISSDTSLLGERIRPPSFVKKSEEVRKFQRVFLPQPERTTLQKSPIRFLQLGKFRIGDVHGRRGSYSNALSRSDASDPKVLSPSQ